MGLLPQLVAMLGPAPVITNSGCCPVPDEPSIHVALSIPVYVISHTEGVGPWGGLPETDEAEGVKSPSAGKPTSDYVSRFGGRAR